VNTQKMRRYTFGNQEAGRKGMNDDGTPKLQPLVTCGWVFGDMRLEIEKKENAR